MAIIQPTQTMLKLFGYLVSYSQSRWYVVYRYTAYFFSWNFLYPMTMYGIEHLSEVAIVVETLSLSAGTWNAMIKGFVLIRNLHILMPMLDALQRNLDHKTSLGRQRHYDAMDRQASLLSRIVFGSMFCSILSIGFGPLMLMLIHRLTVGPLTPEIYRQPVQLALPYDLTAFPAFQLTYVACVLTIICTGSTMLIVDCLFLGFCSHIVACQRDLQDMIRDMDVADDGGMAWIGANSRRSRRPDLGEMFVGGQRRAVERRLKECVLFHYEIVTYVSDLADVYSGVVLTQFVLSVVQMGTLAFQIQHGENITVDRAIANVITSIVAMMELLIYCYYGNLVTHEGEQVAEAAYASPWHRCSVSMRRRIWLVMMRAQQPNYFMGGKLVMCTLQSYTSVLNTIGSALALLRSVV